MGFTEPLSSTNGKNAIWSLDRVALTTTLLRSQSGIYLNTVLMTLAWRPYIVKETDVSVWGKKRQEKVIVLASACNMFASHRILFIKYLAASKRLCGNVVPLCVVFPEDQGQIVNGSGLESSDPVGHSNGILHRCECTSTSRRTKLEELRVHPLHLLIPR